MPAKPDGKTPIWPYYTLFGGIKSRQRKNENGAQRKMNGNLIDTGVMGRYNEYDKYGYNKEGTSGHEE